MEQQQNDMGMMDDDDKPYPDPSLLQDPQDDGITPISVEECTAGPPQCPPEYAQDWRYTDYWIFCNQDGCTLTYLGDDDDDDNGGTTMSSYGAHGFSTLSTGFDGEVIQDFSGTWSGDMTALHGVDGRAAEGDVEMSVSLPAEGDYSIDVEFLNVISSGLDVTGEFPSWAGIPMDRDGSSFDEDDITGQFRGENVTGEFSTNDWDGDYSATRER
ncbi:MAG: hypothetical protein OXN16_07425 [Gammaproteobacteria bacterium]|nr:hypothetical protein [Gammaproteobacteria bacterium]